MRILPFSFVLAVLFLIPGYCCAESIITKVKGIEQRPFSLTGNRIVTWEKDGVRVFVVNKDARILQGPFQITANTVVCWFHEEEAAQQKEATVEVYCEGKVTILEEEENYENYEQVYLRFETMAGIVVNPEIQPIETFEVAQETDIVRRGEEIRSMGKEEYLSTEIPRKVATSEISQKEEMVDIVADTIDSWEERDKRIVVALGNVKIKKENMTVDADSVLLWFDKAESGLAKDSKLPLSEIYAEGNVTVRRKDDLQIADKIFENVKEEKGILINSKIKTTIQKREDKTSAVSAIKAPSQKRKTFTFEGLPTYIQGEEIRLIGKGKYEITNGKISTCGFGHPHYHFQGKKIRLTQRGVHNIVSSTNNAFYLEKYPIAYLPYLVLDVKKDERLLRDWQFGSSSRFGSFFKSDWNLFAVTGGNQKDWSDLILNLDYLQKRGFGTGLDFEYSRQDLFGYLDTYYIKDHGDSDINNVPIENEDRGTILWRHRQELPYDLRLEMEYSYLSDPQFLREYFRQEFKQEKDRETALYLRRIHDTSAETFVINEQFNGFDTTVDSLRERRYAERLPELSYQIIGEPIGDNLLVFSSESTATYFNGSFERVDPEVESESVARVDTANRVSMPFKPGFFNINPFMEGRVTGYTESIETSDAVDEANGPATGRFIGSFGFDWSSTHWRNYSFYNDFFKINRLRHIFVPELRYSYSPIMTKDPDEFYQYDEVDALDSSNVAVIGVKNKLQTKRGEPGLEKTVDFVDFSVDYYFFPSKAGLYNDGINGIIIREDNFINIDFRSQLTDIVAFVSERNEFNTEEFRFDVLSSGIEVYNLPDWQYFFGYRFIRDISSTIMLAGEYTISEKWKVTGEEKYDFKSLKLEEDANNNLNRENKTQNLRTNIILSRYFHDWIGSLTLELDPVRDDSSYRFDLTPKVMEKKPRRFWF